MLFLLATKAMAASAAAPRPNLAIAELINELTALWLTGVVVAAGVVVDAGVVVVCAVD